MIKRSFVIPDITVLREKSSRFARKIPGKKEEFGTAGGI